MDLNIDRFVLKRILSVLTGAVYIDKLVISEIVIFIHRYLFVLLVSVPLVLCEFTTKHNLYVYIFFSISITVLFSLIKLFVFILHKFFDKNERGVPKQVGVDINKKKDQEKEGEQQQPSAEGEKNQNKHEEVINIEDKEKEGEKEVVISIDDKDESEIEKKVEKDDENKVKGGEKEEVVINIKDNDENEVVEKEKKDDEANEKVINIDDKEKIEEEIITIKDKEKEETIEEEIETEIKKEKKTKIIERDVVKTFYFEDENGEIQSYQLNEKETVEVTDDSDSDSDLEDHDKSNKESDEDSDKEIKEKEEGEGEGEDDDSEYTEDCGKKKKRKKKKKKKKENVIPFQIKIFGTVIPILFDRRILEATFDKYDKIIDYILFLFLIILLSIINIYLIYNEVAFWKKCFLSFVIAICYFTLLKSPQPDCNSFYHFNLVNSFSRSYFFIIISSIYISMSYLNFNYYNESLYPYYLIPFYIILIIPFLFLLGMIPNHKTFSFYFMEYIHMHLFGGTGIANTLGVIMFILIDTGISIILVSILTFVNVNNFTSLKFYLFIGSLNFLVYIYSKLSNETFSLFIDYIQTNRVELIKTIKKQICKFLIDILIGLALGIFSMLSLLLFRINIIYYFPFIIIIGWLNNYVLVQLKMFHPFGIFRIPFTFMEYEKVKIVFKVIKYILTLIEILGYIFLISQNFYYIKNQIEIIDNLIISISCIKITRMMYSQRHKLYKIFFLCYLFYYYDCRENLNFMYLMLIISFTLDKFQEFFDKFKYILIYRNIKSIADMFHIVFYPISFHNIPLFLCLLLYSTIFSTPIIPWTGSNLWTLSYPRSVKFWEKKYRTVRKDISSMSFSQSLIAGGGSENYANNLNSVFYEHLCIALKKCKNIFEYFGNLETGDMFIIMNEDLTALVHFVEVGSQFVTFQLRGLEFHGTVCQEKEQEALANAVDVEYDSGLFGGTYLLSVKNFLLKNFANSWKVISRDFYLSTYQRVENKVDMTVNTFDNKKMILTYYVYSISYFVIESERLDDHWVSITSEFYDIINDLNENTYIDRDVFFTQRLDVDFDFEKRGITFKNFLKQFDEFLNICINLKEKKNAKKYNKEIRIRIKKWIFLLSLAARRSLYSVPEFGLSLNYNNTILFIENLYRNFTLDFNVTRELWIFNDTSILKLFSKSLIMSLKIFLQSFVNFEMMTNASEIFKTLVVLNKTVQMCSEKDEKWRKVIMEDECKNIFTLRKIIENNKNENYIPKYIFLQLTKKKRKFNIVKLNKYSVRSLWSSQQNELIFFGNQNKERGSIQQFKNILRNIINTSADIPIGYPCFISGIEYINLYK